MQLRWEDIDWTTSNVPLEVQFYTGVDDEKMANHLLGLLAAELLPQGLLPLRVGYFKIVILPSEGATPETAYLQRAKWNADRILPQPLPSSLALPQGDAILPKIDDMVWESYAAAWRVLTCPPLRSSDS